MSLVRIGSASRTAVAMMCASTTSVVPDRTKMLRSRLRDRSRVVVPVEQQIGQRRPSLRLDGQQSEPQTKRIRSATVNLGELVERVLLIRVESDRRGYGREFMQ